MTNSISSLPLSKTEIKMLKMHLSNGEIYLNANGKLYCLPSGEFDCADCYFNNKSEKFETQQEKNGDNFGCVVGRKEEDIIIKQITNEIPEILL